MSLSPGPLTFSRDRLREVWREGQFVRGRFRIDGYQSFEYDSNHNLKYPRSARKFCLKLYSGVQDPKNHLTELDSHFDSISSRPFMKTSLSESVVSPLLSSWMFLSPEYPVRICAAFFLTNLDGRYLTEHADCCANCQLSHQTSWMHYHSN